VNLLWECSCVGWGTEACALLSYVLCDRKKWVKVRGIYFFDE